MNAEPGKFLQTSRRVLFCAAAPLWLAACADAPRITGFSPPPVDPGSAAAARVEAVLAEPGPYPTFASIPPAPEDVRSDMAWSQSIADVEAARDTLLAESAESTFALARTEAFAEQARTQAAMRADDIPTDAEIAESEAFARRLRERAIPPPSSR